MAKKMDLKSLRPLRGAIVVSNGGHLEQALRRASQLGINDSITFFTPKSPQSESSLKFFEVNFIQNVGSRDIKGTVRAILDLLKLLKRDQFDYVLSTGAGVAIAAFLVCKIKMMDFIYIESIARQNKPSLTGKILVSLQAKNIFTESKRFNFARWNKIDSLFSDYQMREIDKSKVPVGCLKIFVTVGTVHDFEFKRIVELVKSVVIDGDSLIWQIGKIPSAGIPGEVYIDMPNSEFVENISSADVVISHAGVGTILRVLDEGKYPILIPRLAEYQEHIDDHQLEIASLVAGFGLARIVNNRLRREDLLFSGSREIYIREPSG